MVKSDKTGIGKKMNVANFINDEVLQTLANNIKAGSRTFNIAEFDLIQEKLGISIIKGGNSHQKSDIVLDIENNVIKKDNEGFGIKSYLGSKPTLMNASGNTNFIFEVIDLEDNVIDDINSINTRTKLKDRIAKIKTLGGTFKFNRLETDTMQYNLSMVDSVMPTLLSQMLLEFFINRNSAINSNLDSIFKAGHTFETDLIALQVKIKRLLISILLGFFAGKKWDGKYISNGTIVVKASGEQLGFHIIDKDSLENYLFDNIKFDTPSTTRHRYGSLIRENDGKIYFKLNLQLRF
jgi:DNA (cytosine-5)-methyltransferase 1